MKEEEYEFVQQLSVIRAAVNVLSLCYGNAVAEEVRRALYAETDRLYAQMDIKKMVTP